MFVPAFYSLFCFAVVWGNIPKHSFIAWLVVLDCLLTRDQLCQWDSWVPSTCMFCAGLKYRDHLFFEQPLSREAWAAIHASLLLLILLCCGLEGTSLSTVSLLGWRFQIIFLRGISVANGTHRFLLPACFVLVQSLRIIFSLSALLAGRFGLACFRGLDRRIRFPTGILSLLKFVMCGGQCGLPLFCLFGGSVTRRLMVVWDNRLLLCLESLRLRFIFGVLPGLGVVVGDLSL